MWSTNRNRNGETLSEGKKKRRKERKKEREGGEIPLSRKDSMTTKYLKQIANDFSMQGLRAKIELLHREIKKTANHVKYLSYWGTVQRQINKRMRVK